MPFTDNDQCIMASFEFLFEIFWVDFRAEFKHDRNPPNSKALCRSDLAVA